ncbi:MAG: phage tail protein, partial [Verrucomicrobiota bacterium]
FAAQHPPYRRQCFVILKDWLFGRERTSAPNIELVVTREPNQTVITGTAGRLDPELQANPMAFLAEVVTDPVFGLGQAESLLNAPSWQANADALSAEASTTHLSPVLNKGQVFRSVVEETLSYFDGWLRYNRDGLVEAGRWDANAAPPAFTPETTLDFHDLVDEFAFDADSWAETYGAAVVKFTDRERAWKPNAARAVSGLNRGVTGMDRDQSFDRPWVARAAQASLMAAELARVFAEPGLSGTLTVRREKCSAIQPGSLFLLTHDAASLSVVCRCEGKVFSEPPSTRVNLRFRSERRLAPVAYQPAPGNEGISTPPAPEVISLFEFIEPPAALAGADHRLLVLAARTSATTVALRVHLRQADGTLFYELGRQTSFAVFGTLQAAYPDTVPVEDDSETFRVTLDPATVAPDLIPLQETQSADAVDDHNLLAFVLRDDCYPGIEILTVKEVRVAAGESFYRLKVRRAQFGTPRRSFGQGNRVWIIHRASLVFLSHSAFESYAANGTTAFFRLQPRSLYGLEAD